MTDSASAQVEVKLLKCQPIRIERCGDQTLGYSVTLSSRQFLTSPYVESKEEEMIHTQLITQVLRKLEPREEWLSTFTMKPQRNFCEPEKYSDNPLYFSVAVVSELIEVLLEMDPNAKVNLVLKVIATRDGQRRRLEETVTMEALNQWAEFVGADCEGKVCDFGLRQVLLKSTGDIVGETSFSYLCSTTNVKKFAALPSLALDPMEVCRTILKDTINADVTIVTGNGSRNLCHKAFLIARSEIWSAMFKANCVEAKTNTITIQDMDENGVNALLSYIYCWDLDEARKSSHVAVQLLSAGHRYLISPLQTAIKGVLLRKPEHWFRLEDALEMYVVAQGVSERGDSELIRKSMEVIKSRKSELMGCSPFLAFFQSAPQLALKLFATAI